MKKDELVADAGSGPIVSGIAGRYATALFELADEKGQIDAVGKDLARFTGLIDASPDLAYLVKSPLVKAEDQVRAIGAVLSQAGIGGIGGNFIKLAAAKRRLFAVRDMVKAYQSFADAKKGVVRAEVSTAAPLSSADRAAVKQALDQTTGKDVQMSERVDPALIGGLVVKLGSKMVDASVRTKLNSIKLAMNSTR